MEKMTEMKTNRWTQKQRKNLKNPTLSVVSASLPDIEYLYYSLNVEGVTQKVSLLAAHLR